jgi:hypothetical protein
MEPSGNRMRSQNKTGIPEWDACLVGMILVGKLLVGGSAPGFRLFC